MKKSLKRIITLTLSLLLVMSCVVVNAETNSYVDVSADGETIVRVWTDQYQMEMSNPERMASGKDKTGTTQTAVAVKSPQYVVFRVNILETGIYDISTIFGIGSYNKQKFNIYIDGGEAQLVGPIYNGLGNFEPETIKVLTVPLSKGQHTIKAESAGANGYFMGLSFNCVAKTMELEDTKVNGISIKDTDTFSKGSDSIKVYFSADLDAKSVTKNTVKLTYIESGETKDASYDLKTDGKVLTLAPKETFKENVSYTLSINGVLDNFGLTEIKNYTEVLNFDSSVIASGEITAEANLVNRDVTITGEYISSEGVKVSGREVELYFKEIEGEPATTAVTGEDGSFTLNYTFAESQESDTYNFYIKDDYTVSPAIVKVMYITKEKEAELLGSISDMTTADEVYDFLLEYGSVMGIDLSNDLDNVKSPSVVYEKLLNKSYANAEDLQKEFYTCAALETINQATDKETVDIILSSKKDCNLLGIPYDKIHTIINNYQGYLGDVLALDSKDDVIAFQKALEPVTEKWIEIEAGYHYVDIAENEETIVKSYCKDYTSELSGATIASGGGQTFVTFKTGHYVIFRANVLKAGIYDISIGWGTASAYSPTFAVTVDKEEAVEVTPKYTGLGTYVPEYKQVLRIPLEAGYHKIKVHGISASGYLMGTSLNCLVGEMKIEDIKVNGVSLKDTNSFSKGSDSIKVYMSEEIDKESVTSETVKLTYVENGQTKNASVSLKTDGKVLTLAPKETFKENVDYTLTINGVKDNYDYSSVENSVSLLKFNESVISSGTIVSEAKLNYGDANLTGKYISSEGEGISGRLVEVYLDEVNGAPVSSALTDENGEFAINYQFTQAQSVGMHTFILKDSYTVSPLEVEVMYITKAKEEELLDSLSKKTTADEVYSFLSEYGAVMGIDVLNDLDNVTDKSAVYKGLLNKTFDDAEDLKKEFYTYVALETINQATTKETIDTVLKSEKDCALLGIPFDRIPLIEENYDSYLNDVLNMESKKDAKAFKEALEPITEKWLAEEYGYSDMEIDEDDKSAYKGEGIKINIGFTEDAENLKEALIKIAVSDEDMIDYMTYEAAENVSFEVNAINGLIEIVADYSGDEAVRKLGEIYLTAPEKVGEYDITISGTIVFAENESLLLTTNVITKVIDVTVKKTPSTGGGSGSGSSSGRTSSIGSSMSVSDYNEQVEKEETEKTEKLYKFNDISEVSWAEESIYSLLEKGIISESEDNCFNPMRNITREEFVKMLVCALDLESTDSDAVFKDVASNAWYAPYIAAAAENGLVTGNENNEFCVGEYITRQDMSVMVARALSKLGFEFADDEYVFADDSEISGYAKDSVYMMKKAGIINGVGEDMFAPRDNATRAMAAKIIYGVTVAVKK